MDNIPNLSNPENQSIDDVKFVENNIIDIYKKFVYKNTNVLVIKIRDWSVTNYFIVKDIEFSTKPYKPPPKKKDDESNKSSNEDTEPLTYRPDINNIDNIPIPSYIYVHYYPSIGDLNRIAESNKEGEDKKGIKYAKLLYNKWTEQYDVNEPNIITKYENGFFIYDYMEQHYSKIQNKRNYEKRYAEYQSSNNPIRRPLEQIKPQINILDILKYSDLNNYEKEQLKEIVRKIGFAGLLVGLFALMFHLENKMKMKGGDPNTENYIHELANIFTPDQARELANKIKTLVDKKAVIEEINNLDGDVKNDIKRNIVKDEDFKEFKLEEGQTVFGNLFGDEDKKEGGKRKRTNKKRKTNKRKNNKKKSNRRYTDKV